MGQHRALYQIGGISPGQKNNFTTARPLAKARDFCSGLKAEKLKLSKYFPQLSQQQTSGEPRQGLLKAYRFHRTVKRLPS
jgi:hypothetical protein